MSTCKPRIGVSACLLGNRVRFDGGHRKSDFVHGVLGRFVDFVPVCPEVEAGLSVPRESLRLVASSGGVRLLGHRSGADHSERLASWARERIAGLGALDLDGFILKKDSPSCGLERVRLYRSAQDREPARHGSGVFAALLRARLPALPLTEEGWLQDRGLRASFLERIFTHHRMRTVLFEEPTTARLVAFHAEHKLLYLARSPSHCRDLGRLVAGVAGMPLQTALDRYGAGAMAALRERASPGKHANVLQHILGTFKRVLTGPEKRELLGLIEDFRAGLHDHAVPLTLLVHHLRKHAAGGWLARQVYLDPYPRALAVG